VGCHFIAERQWGQVQYANVDFLGPLGGPLILKLPNLALGQIAPHENGHVYIAQSGGTVLRLRSIQVQRGDLWLFPCPGNQFFQEPLQIC